VDTFERFDAIAPFSVHPRPAASFAVITVVFALIFKFLPDVTVSWRDVWWGAAITSALFVIGKFAIGFYIGASDVGSAYGAAGSLIVVLVWIYYSSIILLYGAEFTQVWSTRAPAARPAEPIASDRPSPSDHLASAQPPSDRGLVVAALVWVAVVVWGWVRKRQAG
jgi:membrane protein